MKSTMGEPATLRSHLALKTRPDRDMGRDSRLPVKTLSDSSLSCEHHGINHTFLIVNMDPMGQRQGGTRIYPLTQ